MSSKNGSSSKQPLTLSEETIPTPAPKPTLKRFDQPVVLQQSPMLSRAIVWTIIGVTTSVLVWASVATIEEAVSASGKLEPQGEVKEVQVPVSGVVKAVYVKDGQRVKKGDLLLSLDPTVSRSQINSLNKVRTALIEENQFYRLQMNKLFSPAVIEREVALLKLPAGIASLAKSRATLAAENRLYQAQLGSLTQGVALTPEQQERLQSSQAELNTRFAAARLETEQLKKQLRQNELQLANTQDILALNQGILKDLDRLANEGGISRIQFLKQKQEVQTRQAEVERLTQEDARLRLTIAQAQEKANNTLALTRNDTLTKTSDNEKDIAEIDSQFTKAIVENEKRIAEIDSQLSQANQTSQYEKLHSPVNGIVFDMKANTPGFVTNTSDPVLKIVPNDNLVAKVFITNSDIGFVKEGMQVDVRIDSFPFSEFGDIKGELVSVGSDALPPTEVRQFYSFPAKIRLDRQTLLINNREIPLQSGMSLNANIKIRNRTVMSIFTDLFTQQIESLKFVR